MPSKDSEDPYEQFMNDDNNLVEAPERESARTRKWRILTTKLTQLKMQAQQGFMIGAMVGGSFGFIVGCYQAVVTRQFLILPASTIISGLSFGFFLGCGSMVRSDSEMYFFNFRINQQYYYLNQDQRFISDAIWQYKFKYDKEE